MVFTVFVSGGHDLTGVGLHRIRTFRSPKGSFGRRISRFSIIP